MSGQRFVIEVEPYKWLALTTAKSGGYHVTNVWGEAYRCSEAMADTILKKISSRSAKKVPVDT